jgi:hypothetical protein
VSVLSFAVALGAFLLVNARRRTRASGPVTVQP